MRQTPWDITRLAHIVKLELHGAVDAADYVPDAFNLLQQLSVEIPRQEKVQKLLLWKLTTPQGRQHWLLGTMHADFNLKYFSVPAQQTLHELLRQVDMLLHEGNIPYGSSSPAEAYQQLEHQLITHARRLNKETAPLDNIPEAIQARRDQLNTEIRYAEQLEARLDQMV